MKKEAILYKKLTNNKIQCLLCSHFCKIPESDFGFCQVRQNIKGKLFTHVYGKTITQNIDPIEKKPLYHFLPGSKSFSIATLGCNFKCNFCQNWRISQANKKTNLFNQILSSPEEIVLLAKKNNCKSISYTYTEPTIFFEYALDISKIAKKNNISNIFVTNGYMSKEAINIIEPYLDAVNIDLKFFNDKTYKKNCKAKLQPVLDSIETIKKKNIWTEITTLIIPNENDTEKELYKIAEFISKVSKDIPWHISKFHPDYNYKNSYPTPLETLDKAKQIGTSLGLKYIYLGNIRTKDSNTICPECKNIVIERDFYSIIKNNLEKGRCPKCKKEIKGIWNYKSNI